MKKKTARLYFWHASRSIGNGTLELSSGELSLREAVKPGFFEEVREAIGKKNNWPINSFSIVSLSFLGEYEHETG